MLKFNILSAVTVAVNTVYWWYITGYYVEEMGGCVLHIWALNVPTISPESLGHATKSYSWSFCSFSLIFHFNLCSNCLKLCFLVASLVVWTVLFISCINKPTLVSDWHLVWLCFLECHNWHESHAQQCN